MFKKIKRNLKGIKILKEIHKNLHTDNNNPIFSKEEITNRGFIIRKNTMMLSMAGIGIAGLQIVNFSDIGEVPCIIYDDRFMLLNEESRNFVIYHELGHFQLQRDILLEGLVGRKIEFEYEADKYAADVVGKDIALQALKDIKELIYVSSFGKEKKGIDELNRRIEYIMSL